MKLNITALIVALVFGLVALGIVLVGFTIPIGNTGIVTDPREIFVTLGSAFTGPLGGLIIGFLAGIKEPGGIYLASLLGHIAGALWMAFSYKKLVYERMEMPARILGWAALVLVYYYIFVVPGFVIGLTVFYAQPDPIGSYIALATGVIPEAAIATVVTSLVMLALPRAYQKPLW